MVALCDLGTSVDCTVQEVHPNALSTQLLQELLFYLHFIVVYTFDGYYKLWYISENRVNSFEYLRVSLHLILIMICFCLNYTAGYRSILN